MIYATLNLDTWMMDFARAGHPYPLLLRADGPSTFLDRCRRARLSARDGGGLRRAARRAGAGGDPSPLHGRADRAAGPDALRGRGGSRGGRWPQRRTSPSSSAGRSSSASPRDIEPADDIAVLAVRAVGLHDTLEVEVPAEAEPAGDRPTPDPALGGGQRRHGRRLRRLRDRRHRGLRERGRACVRTGGATIDLGAAWSTAWSTVTVRDRGVWREPRGGNRGRGIPVMKEFMDDVVDRHGRWGYERWSWPRGSASDDA